jgi:hypothetical protein
MKTKQQPEIIIIIKKPGILDRMVSGIPIWCHGGAAFWMVEEELSP